MMATVITTFGMKLVGLNYEIGWDPQDPFESDENFDAPWEFDYFTFGAVKDGEMNIPNRANQLPPLTQDGHRMKDQYNELYQFGQWFRQVFNQF